MTQYIIRLDDACLTMHKERWSRVEAILDHYHVQPIVAVIPNNRDHTMHVDNHDPLFWEKVRRWQKKGWVIALHGYDHVYISQQPGLVPINQKSEFAGVPLQIQKEKIREGMKIFKSEHIVPRIFVAPAHTLDKNTLVALQEESEIRIISDGLARYPYRQHGFLWIPQQSWQCIQKECGVWTTCLHPNTMEECAFKWLEKFLILHGKYFTVNIDAILTKYNNRRRNLFDIGFYQCFFLQRRLGFIRSKIKKTLKELE